MLILKPYEQVKYEAILIGENIFNEFKHLVNVDASKYWGFAAMHSANTDAQFCSPNMGVITWPQGRLHTTLSFEIYKCDVMMSIQIDELTKSKLSEKKATQKRGNKNQKTTLKKHTCLLGNLLISQFIIL